MRRSLLRLGSEARGVLAGARTRLAPVVDGGRRAAHQPFDALALGEHVVAGVRLDVVEVGSEVAPRRPMRQPFSWRAAW